MSASEDQVERGVTAFVEAREAGRSVRDAIAQVIAGVLSDLWPADDAGFRRAKGAVILTTAARLSGLSRGALVAHERRGEFHASIRRACMVAMRRLRFSLPEIGRVLGRHHATVMHGLRSATKQDRELATRILAECGLVAPSQTEEARDVA